MATKRKSSAPPPPPPPRSPSPSTDEDSSSEEEQEVAQHTPSLAKTPKGNERVGEEPDSESESESESESDPEEPPKETPVKYSKTKSSSSDEEEDEEETEKPKSPVKKKGSESKPKSDKKEKQKLLGPDQSPSQSQKSSHAFPPRIWNHEDEMKLLQALSEYRASKGQLPLPKDYAAFHSTISGSIGFPVTAKQLSNKVRQMRHNYNTKIKKGTHANISKSHDKAVFKMCSELFEGGSNVPNSNKKVKLETKGADVKKMVNGGAAAANGHALGGAANGGVADIGDGMPRSNFCYLRGLMEDLIKEKQCLGWLASVERVIAQIGESRANDLEAKTKKLRIDAMKMRAREDGLSAELLGILADEMADD